MVEAPEFNARCLADPLYFARAAWGRERWVAQRRIRRALATYAFIVIFSANGVGKTSELAAWIIEDVVLNPGTRFTLTGPRLDSIREGLFGEIRDLYYTSKISLGGDMQTDRWILGERWDVGCTTADQPSSYQGRRGKVKTKVVIDEAQGDIRPEHWDALESLLTGDGSQMVAMGNPITTGGRFREIATDPSRGWHAISISALDHPNVKRGVTVLPGPSLQEIERKRRAWGETDPRWIARVLGCFPSASPDQLVSEAWMLSGFERWKAAGAGWKTRSELAGKRVGFDAARMGDDKCVATLWVDGVLTEIEEWGHHLLHESGARLRAFAERHRVPPENVKLDETGVGSGAKDDCTRVGWAVEGVDFGSGAQGDWPDLTSDMDIRNRRCELHWILARLIKDGDVVIPVDDERFRQVREDLVQPRYRFPNGIFEVERKEEIKKRLGHSPDHGDSALCMVSNTGSSGCGVTRVRLR